MFEKMLVAIDGSPASEKALAAAVDLTEHYDSDLVAVGVVDLPEVVGMVDEVDEMRQSADARFRGIGEAAVNFALSRGVQLRFVALRGHVADAILRYAEAEHIRLIVMGQHGHSRIARFLLGSTSDRVSEHSHCSVMIVK
jgi:nucleotide-binding universal stress UspA family protein